MRYTIANILFSSILLILSIVLYYLTKNFPAGLRAMGYGPSFYIRVILVALFSLSAVIFISNVFKYFKENKEKQSIEKIIFPNLSSFGIYFLLLFGVIIFFEKLGFVVSSFIFLYLFMIISKINIIKGFIVSLGLTMTVYYIFYIGLRVPLPTFG